MRKKANVSLFRCIDPSDYCCDPETDYDCKVNQIICKINLSQRCYTYEFLNEILYLYRYRYSPLNIFS